MGEASVLTRLSCSTTASEYLSASYLRGDGGSATNPHKEGHGEGLGGQFLAERIFGGHVGGCVLWLNNTRDIAEMKKFVSFKKVSLLSKSQNR